MSDDRVLYLLWSIPYTLITDINFFLDKYFTVVVAPANATVEAATKLATSQPEVNYTSLNGPQPAEDNTTQQQLEKLVYAATVTAEAAGNTEQ